MTAKNWIGLVMAFSPGLIGLGFVVYQGVLAGLGGLLALMLVGFGVTLVGVYLANH